MEKLELKCSALPSGKTWFHVWDKSAKEGDLCLCGNSVYHEVHRDAGFGVVTTVKQKKITPPEIIEIIEDLVRACGSGMNWMEQVDRAAMGSAIRGILHVDMGMTSAAIHKARTFLESVKDDQA